MPGPHKKAVALMVGSMIFMVMVLAVVLLIYSDCLEGTGQC